jgi:hypothetical protein
LEGEAQGCPNVGIVFDYQDAALRWGFLRRGHSEIQ